MKPKSIVVIGSMALVLAACIGMWEADRTGKRRESLRESLQRQVEDQSKCRVLEKQLMSAQVEAVALRTLLEKTRQKNGPSSGVEKADNSAGVPALYARLQNDPEFQIKWVSAKRFETQATYGAFFRMTKLAPGEIRAFEENTLKWQEQQMDFDALVQSHGGHAHVSPELGKLAADERAEYESNQRAVLGEKGFGQWQEYERTTSVRDFVDGFAGAAVLAGQPYTAQQVEDLVGLIAQASVSYREHKAAGLSEVDWTKIDEQAGTILSPEQLEAFVSTEPLGPTNASGRHHADFWYLVAKAQKAEAAGTAANQTASR